MSATDLLVDVKDFTNVGSRLVAHDYKATKLQGVALVDIPALNVWHVYENEFESG